MHESQATSPKVKFENPQEGWNAGFQRINFGRVAFSAQGAGLSNVDPAMITSIRS
jgi:hypothetical protein